MKLRECFQNFAGIIYFLSILLLVLTVHFQEHDIHASSSIIINEILYDPSGTDLGNEWLELYNPLDVPINLTDWKIQIAGTTFTTALTIPSITILPHGYFTVCESNVTGCSINVPRIGSQNGGSESDGIQLLDNKSNVVDTVIFDSPNTNNLTNEDGVVVESNQSATPSGSGKSIGRKNFIDTNNSHNDFYVLDIPSLGAANPLSEELAPTGDYPLFILLLILFILLSYSARLNRYLINLLTYFDAKRKK